MTRIDRLAGAVAWRRVGAPLWIVVSLAVLAFASNGFAVSELDEILNLEDSGQGVASTTDVGVLTDPTVGLPVGSVSDSSSVERLETELVAARLENTYLRSQLEALRSDKGRELHLAYYNMGCVYRAIKDFKRAEEQFLKALATDPEDPAVHFNLGILYDDDLGDKKRARLHYERFLELAPDDGDVPQVKQWLSMME